MSTGVEKIGYVLPVSAELLAEFQGYRDAYARLMAMTDEERLEATRKAMADRAEERRITPLVVTLDGLLDKLGWSVEYATHVVQPYCTCQEGMDGWERCEHAVDLGLDP